MHRAAAVSRDYLAFLLWPDEEEGVARGRLRSTISDLLRVLPQPGGDFIGTNTEDVWWNGEVELWLDVNAFSEAATDPGRLEEAVALYRGDLLPELYDEWLYGFRERLRNVYLTALTQLVSALRKRGEFTRAIEVARKILEADPWREDIVRRIVALRYESGDAAGAISEYRTFESRLREEMGVDPMPETVALAERVVRGDIAGEDDGDAMAAPVPRGDERRRLLPFAGREREIERLSEAWSRAKMQRGGIVFIGGEPGIGKSRLVREFMASVEESGRTRALRRDRFPRSVPLSVFGRRAARAASARCGHRYRRDVVCGLNERAAGAGAARRAAAGATGNPRLRSAAAALRRVGTGARRAGAAPTAARRARRSALGEPGDLRRARVFATTNRRRTNSFLGDVSRQRDAGTPSTAPARPRSDGRRQCGLAFGTAARPQDRRANRRAFRRFFGRHIARRACGGAAPSLERQSALSRSAPRSALARRSRPGNGGLAGRGARRRALRGDADRCRGRGAGRATVLGRARPRRYRLRRGDRRARARRTARSPPRAGDDGTRHFTLCVRPPARQRGDRRACRAATFARAKPPLGARAPRALPRARSRVRLADRIAARSGSVVRRGCGRIRRLGSLRARSRRARRRPARR